MSKYKTFFTVITALIICVIYISCTTQKEKAAVQQTTVFNDHFYSLEKLYGNVHEISINYYCVNQTITRDQIATNNNAIQNFVKAVNADIAQNGIETPNIKPSKITYVQNKIMKLEYADTVLAIVSIDFLYDEFGAAGNIIKIGDQISEKIEISKRDSLHRLTQAKDLEYWDKKPPSMSSIKTYEYNEQGFCVSIVHSQYWTSKYNYDDQGFIKDATTITKSGQKITTYTILEYDTHNNWTKRLVMNDGNHCNYVEERVISYL